MAVRPRAMAASVLRSTAPRRWLLLLTIAAACASAAPTHVRVSLATETPVTPTVANPICALSVERLVFTLADLSKQNCGSNDTRCSSLCWCRQWASAPVTSATLAQCVAVGDSASCVGQDQVDCRSVLALAPSTGSNATSNAAINSDSGSSQKLPSRTSPWVYVLVTLLLVGVVAGVVFAVNWYRHRPRSLSAPATVTLSEQERQGGPLTWTEADSYDEKLPATLPITLPTRRGSMHSVHSDKSAGGPMQIDYNASIISGVSGTSYHDLDGTQLGHLNEAHALTDTELSLSRDAARPHVFSPLSANGSVALTDSHLSTDSVDARFQPDGRSVAQRAYSPLGQDTGPQTHQDSSFISVASTTYLTHNDTFSSQLTMLESDPGSTTSTTSSMFRETEF